MGGVSVHGAVLRGVEAVPVEVEVDIAGGIPGITIVGMADTTVMEARARVRCALRAAGFEIPRMHITVNLAPADLRKSGTGLDLPMAAAILAATAQIPTAGMERALFVGEVNLEGQVHPVRGDVAYDLLAKERGLEVVGRSTGESGLVEVVRRSIGHLSELHHPLGTLGFTPGPQVMVPVGSVVPDYADVVDQELAKRAMVLAAAGHHGLLMVGPPGAGKTMLARRMAGILPPLSKERRVEAALIHSVAGKPIDAILQGAPPFQAPHHSISTAGLVGGGRPVLPGQISLAHRGVLFLDELPEFAPSTLQALRQPMEDGEVRIVRAEGTFSFPCSFQLVAAANPCPCGYLGDPDHRCRCTPAAQSRYRQRIGGPLMDRIDLHVDVARPSTSDLVRGAEGMDSVTMAQAVETAREFASWREARMGEEPRTMAALGLDDRAQGALESLGRRAALGGRAVVRVARVARTIADLRESATVTADDVAEAAVFRVHGVGAEEVVAHD